MSQATTAPVLVEGVTKRFRQGKVVVEALRNLSLTVRTGEFLAVMGASGSGKSTLLHVIAGLTRPDEGRVVVNGQDLGKMSDRALTLFRRRQIGLVFQSFNLIASLRAEDNILLPVLLEGGGTTARLPSLLDRLQIADRRRHFPDALSGGEQQRVAIARALAANPSLILADEPTGSLDSVTGRHLCRLLKELHEEQGRTVVVVTHEPAVAIWAERIVVLRDGQVQAEFSTADFADAHLLAAHYHEVVGIDDAPARKEA
jgi:putative ABC transport system ATP-binding protein